MGTGLAALRSRGKGHDVPRSQQAVPGDRREEGLNQLPDTKGSLDKPIIMCYRGCYRMEVFMTEDLTDALTRTYRLRKAQPGKRTAEVTIPYEVLEREARKYGLSIDDFMKTFIAVAHFDSFPGVYYTFEQIEGEVSDETQDPSSMEQSCT